VRDIDEITGDVVDLALRIHRDLGPGLLESVYETVLAGKLLEMGYSVDRQRPVDIEFEGQRFKEGLRRVVNDHVPSASPRLRVNQN
jgi:iron complex transport system substrate-binding protein